MTTLERITIPASDHRNSTSNQCSGKGPDCPNVSQTLKTVVVFESCVVIVGIIGALANGLVIWVMTRSNNNNKERRASSVLILHQLVLDFSSCILLIVTYLWKLTNAKLRGSLNVILCFFIGSENLQWTCLNSSITNLVFIALERYVKIVHPILHRNFYKSWMTRVSIAFTWAVGILTNFPTTWLSTDFTDGNCGAYTIWSNQDALGYGIFYLLVSYVLPMMIFIYCYLHIWLVIHRRGRIGVVEPRMPAVVDISLELEQQGKNGHTSDRKYVEKIPNSTSDEYTCTGQKGSNTRPTKSHIFSIERSISHPHQQHDVAGIASKVPHYHRSKHTVLKTMVIITVLFATSWCPCSVYFFLLSLNCCGSLSVTSDTWYASLFVAFLSQCLQPFIYGSKFNNVRVYVRKLFLKSHRPNNDITDWYVELLKSVYSFTQLAEIIVWHW